MEKFLRKPAGYINRDGCSLSRQRAWNFLNQITRSDNTVGKVLRIPQKQTLAGFFSVTCM